MPIPEFVASLRSAVGHDRLLLSGVTAVVRNDRGEVLLGLRSDNRRWSLISGILEPGEQPAEALRREIREETGVEAVITGLAGVWMMPETRYPNGDVAQYLDLCFVARHVAGEPYVADDESLEVGWFDPDRLPEGLTDTARRKLAGALRYDGHTQFLGDAGSPDGDAPLDVPDAALGGPAPTLVLDRLSVDGRDVVVRAATAADVPAVVALIADDQLGARREDPSDHAAYLRAFAAIDADPAQHLVVLDDAGTVVGTAQLSVIPGLARRGALRGQVEAVRVASTHRGRRLGELLLRWAVEESRRQGCAVVQLTTDKSRVDAHRFYERLGFTASHEGFKLALTGE